MKRSFTKIAGTALFLSLIIAGFQGKAQQTLAAADTKSTDTKKEAPATTTTETKVAAKPAEDTSWKPQRRVWGYAFGDFYYNAHADATNRGPETMYNGVPTYRNAFQFRRLYLGYDYEITKKFKAEVLLASEPNANTGTVGATTTLTGVPGGSATTTTNISNGDNLVDGKMAFWIKNFNIRVRDLWTGTDFVIGEMATPGFALNEPGTNGPMSLSESTWAYRSIEKTVTDFHKNNSYDIGAALQGTFDPSTKNFGYVFMVGNNSQASLLGASNANTGFYKIFYFDLWGKFANNHLYVDLYAHTLRTAPATAAIPDGQAHTMFKAFVAYLSKPINIGVEAYTQSFKNGVTDKTSNSPADATAHGLSIWVRGPIVKNLNYFGRFDTYNPYTDYTVTDAYSVNTNYGSYNPTYKEKFYTFGVDYNPTKNVHFEPNIWLTEYSDQRASTTTGYVAGDHTLVYRFTFFYTFGK